MNKSIELAGQHIRESESHLRHIDELMARAGEAALKEHSAAQAKALLGRVQPDRDRVAEELDAIRRLPIGDGAVVVKRGAGLRGAMETISLELDSAITEMFRINK